MHLGFFTHRTYVNGSFIFSKVKIRNEICLNRIINSVGMQENVWIMLRFEIIVYNCERN